MTAAPPKSIAFHINPKEIDSINWTSTRHFFTDLILFSKYLHYSTTNPSTNKNNFHFLKFFKTSATIPKKVDKQSTLCRRRIGSSSVKYASNYRASRLAHYQDLAQEDGSTRGSFRPSRRCSNLSGYSINSLYDTTTLQPMTLERLRQVDTNDEINNNVQRHSSDEATVSAQCKVNQAESRTENRCNPSSNDKPQNVRSQSIGATSNINNRTVLTSVHNRSNPDTTELAQFAVRANTTSRHHQNPRTCYFCWCCCCSCSCLNIKPKLDESLRPQISNEPLSKLEAMTNDERLTLEEAQKWAQNFEFLMQHLGGRKIFHEFLKLEYSEENIMFYKAVEELHAECDESIVEEKARSIYEDYISILSPKEVSLDSRVRELINSDMAQPSSRTFDEAQSQIFTLMQRDSYPRFLNSRLYKDMVRQLGGTSTTSNSQTLSESRQMNNA